MPVDLGGELAGSIPANNQSLINDIDVFVCENIKTARRFLIKGGLPSPIPQHIRFVQLEDDENTAVIEEVLSILKSGKPVAYLSEAGNPCIADPGEQLVSHAHNNQIQVVPLVGPSSILLALIASGLNGEHFTFSGYLSRDNAKRRQEIKQLVEHAKKGITQLFMETPYRNEKLFEELLQTVPAQMSLCLAVDLTTSEEYISTRKISEWKGKAPVLHKRPCIFVLGN